MTPSTSLSLVEEAGTDKSVEDASIQDASGLCAFSYDDDDIVSTSSGRTMDSVVSE